MYITRKDIPENLNIEEFIQKSKRETFENMGKNLYFESNRNLQNGSNSTQELKYYMAPYFDFVKKNAYIFINYFSKPSLYSKQFKKKRMIFFSNLI